MSCKQCGRCCVTANIKLPGVKVNDGSGFAEWLAMHRCDVMDYGADGLSVRIPLTCMQLGENKAGEYFCKIYDSRPEICRDYLCKKAKGMEEKTCD